MFYSDPKRNAVFRALYMGKDPLKVCGIYDADLALAIIVFQGRPEELPLSTLRRETLLAELTVEQTGELAGTLRQYRPTLDVAAWSGGKATGDVPSPKVPTVLPTAGQNILLKTVREMEVAIVKNGGRVTGQMDEILSLLTGSADTMQQHLRIDPITRFPLMKILQKYDQKHFAYMMGAMYNAVLAALPFDECPVISFADKVTFATDRKKTGGEAEPGDSDDDTSVDVATANAVSDEVVDDE